MNWNLGIPTHADDAIDVKSRIDEPSGLVIPAAFIMRATTYEIITPIKIGIILNKPFPQILKMIITPSAIIARTQFVEALLIAEPASERPMHMIIGPVTTGGRNRITRLIPTSLIIRASTK